MSMNLRPEAQELLERVSNFLESEVAPNEAKFHEQIKTDENRWNYFPEIVEELKDKAKSQGLWNLFLPESEFGAGLTNYEYAHLAEQMGKYSMGSEVFNCSAPDTGNMEVIARYGNEKHQEEWLKPLLDGEIRSCFGMTEPGVASSDATNMQATAVLDGDEYVINGEKWWTSGAGDPRCKIMIFMGVTNPDNAKHQRHSMILVPSMRAIGVGERALELMCTRGIDPNKNAFGKPLAQLGGNFDHIADSRIELNAARLLTLDAAHKMDTVGNKVAASEIAQIKVMVPNIVLDIIDRAIQIHGGEGVSQLTPLASMFAHMRTLRLADGPDEVHRRAVARYELGKYISK